MNIEPKHLLLIAIVGGLIIAGVAIQAKDKHATTIEGMSQQVIDKLPDCSQWGKKKPNCDDCRKSPVYQRLVRESVPYLDLPMEFRVNNYKGGSCVHASTATLLHWQGMHEFARWWTSNYAYGEGSGRLHKRMDAANLKYAYTMNNDLEWLERCCKLRLGCIVNWPSNHMVTLVGIDDTNVYIIDNNSISRITVRSRESFNRGWTGWATTLVYVPNPPPPKPL